MITLKKFEYGDVKNYFSVPEPTFVDNFESSKIHIEGLPSFTEEFENTFDAFNLVFSDFTIKFSLLQTEISSNGLTIGEFLSTDIENHCIVCAVAYKGRTFSGIVDIQKIWFRETRSNNDFDVSLTVYDWAKELKDLGQSAPSRIAWEKPFSLYLDKHFTDTPSNFLLFNTGNLDWSDKGGEPELITELWDVFFDPGGRLAFPNQPAEVTRWGLFEDLCKFWGLIYSFEIAQLGFTGVIVVMNLAFRDTGYSSRSVTIDATSKEWGFTKSKQLNKYVYFKYMQGTNIKGAIGSREIVWNDPNIGYGVLYNSDVTYYSRGSQHFVQAGLSFDESIIKYVGQEGINMTDHYTVNLQHPGAVDIPIQDVTEITASYYFNPSTQEGQVNAHWSYGEHPDRLQWKEQYFQFRPKNFSFPAMWIPSGYVITLLQTESLNNGTQPQWFRMINYANRYIYDEMATRWGGHLSQYPELIKDQFKRLYRIGISFLNDTIKRLFDITAIDGRSCTLKKIQDIDVLNKEYDSEWREL